MDSYFKGVWWLTKRSMTLFKYQKSLKRWHSKKVSWVVLLATTATAVKRFHCFKLNTILKVFKETHSKILGNMSLEQS